MMALFPILESDAIVQVGDKVRLDASNSFVSKGSNQITTMTIMVEAATTPIDIFSDDLSERYLDWVYTGSSRSVVITLTIGDGASTSVFTKTVNVVTEADDALFSNDNDIKGLETDILKWLPEGRSTFKFVHREAQKRILDWLDESGVYATDGTRLTKTAIANVDEVRSWSRDLALSLIFRGINNSREDVFLDKARHYESEALNRANRARLRLNTNVAGQPANTHSVNMKTRELYRS